MKFIKFALSAIIFSSQIMVLGKKDCPDDKIDRYGVLPVAADYTPVQNSYPVKTDYKMAPQVNPETKCKRKKCTKKGCPPGVQCNRCICLDKPANSYPPVNPETKCERKICRKCPPGVPCTPRCSCLDKQPNPNPTEPITKCERKICRKCPPGVPCTPRCSCLDKQPNPNPTEPITKCERKICRKCPPGVPCTPQCSCLDKQPNPEPNPEPNPINPVKCKKRTTALTSSKKTSSSPSSSSSPIATPAASKEISEPSTKSPTLPSGINAAEVAKHASASDCYIVFKSSVYDMTAWVSTGHPGGSESIAKFCGKTDDGFANAFQKMHPGRDISASGAKKLSALV